MHRIAFLLLLAGCSAAPAPVALVEGYCTGSEGDRCYFDKPPNDGF